MNNIWEEKSYTEPEKNFLSCNVLGQEDITNEIKSDSTSNKCKDIGKKWERKCPDCSDILFYSNKYTLANAKKAHTRCKRCSLKTPKAINNLRLGQMGRKHTESTLQKMRGNNNGMYGVYRCGEQNPFYGKKHTEKTRKKMRLAMCKKIVQKNKETGQIANVNPNETKYFTKLDVEMEWNGIFYGKSSEQHLLDIGYFVDYYEPTLNIVVEYDEPRHYRCGKLRSRDVERMNNIKIDLGCRFLRYNEKTGLLTEY